MSAMFFQKVFGGGPQPAPQSPNARERSPARNMTERRRSSSRQRHDYDSSYSHRASSRSKSPPRSRRASTRSKSPPPRDRPRPRSRSRSRSREAAAALREPHRDLPPRQRDRPHPRAAVPAGGGVRCGPATIRVQCGVQGQARLRETVQLARSLALLRPLQNVSAERFTQRGSEFSFTFSLAWDAAAFTSLLLSADSVLRMRAAPAQAAPINVTLALKGGEYTYSSTSSTDQTRIFLFSADGSLFSSATFLLSGRIGDARSVLAPQILGAGDSPDQYKLAHLRFEVNEDSKFEDQREYESKQQQVYLKHPTFILVVKDAPLRALPTALRARAARSPAVSVPAAGSAAAPPPAAASAPAAPAPLAPPPVRRPLARQLDRSHLPPLAAGLPGENAQRPPHVAAQPERKEEEAREDGSLAAAPAPVVGGEAAPAAASAPAPPAPPPAGPLLAHQPAPPPVPPFVQPEQKGEEGQEGEEEAKDSGPAAPLSMDARMVIEAAEQSEADSFLQVVSQCEAELGIDSGGPHTLDTAFSGPTNVLLPLCTNIVSRAFQAGLRETALRIEVPQQEPLLLRPAEGRVLWAYEEDSNRLAHHAFPPTATFRAVLAWAREAFGAPEANLCHLAPDAPYTSPIANLDSVLPPDATPTFVLRCCSPLAGIALTWPPLRTGREPSPHRQLRDRGVIRTTIGLAGAACVSVNPKRETSASVSLPKEKQAYPIVLPACAAPAIPQKASPCPAPRRSPAADRPCVPSRLSAQGSVAGIVNLDGKSCFMSCVLTALCHTSFPEALCEATPSQELGSGTFRACAIEAFRKLRQSPTPVAIPGLLKKLRAGMANAEQGRECAIGFFLALFSAAEHSEGAKRVREKFALRTFPRNTCTAGHAWSGNVEHQYFLRLPTPSADSTLERSLQTFLATAERGGRCTTPACQGRVSSTVAIVESEMPQQILIGCERLQQVARQGKEPIFARSPIKLACPREIELGGKKYEAAAALHHHNRHWYATVACNTREGKLWKLYNDSIVERCHEGTNPLDPATVCAVLYEQRQAAEGETGVTTSPETQPPEQPIIPTVEGWYCNLCKAALRGKRPAVASSHLRGAQHQRAAALEAATAQAGPLRSRPPPFLAKDRHEPTPPPNRSAEAAASDRQRPPLTLPWLPEIQMIADADQNKAKLARANMKIKELEMKEKALKELLEAKEKQISQGRVKVEALSLKAKGLELGMQAGGKAAISSLSLLPRNGRVISSNPGKVAGAGIVVSAPPPAPAKILPPAGNPPPAEDGHPGRCPKTRRAAAVVAAARIAAWDQAGEEEDTDDSSDKAYRPGPKNE